MTEVDKLSQELMYCTGWVNVRECTVRNQESVIIF